MAGTPKALRRTLAFGSACAVALALCACGVTGDAELGVTQCRPGDGRDDDRDGLVDCADPDCWVYDFCLAEQTASVKALDGSVAAISDSAVPIEPARDGGETGDDAGGDPITPVFDAALPPETCGVTHAICDTGEICTNGVCKAAPHGSQFLLRVTGAAIPDQRKDTVCFDNAATSTSLCSLSPAAVCGACKPDPYVLVSINATAKFQTEVVTDSVAPGWNEAKTRVTLLPDDVLRFTVKDFDMYGPHAVVFYCEVVFTAAMAQGSGLIQCYPDPAMTIAPLLPGLKWVINAEYEPAPDVIAQ